MGKKGSGSWFTAVKRAFSPHKSPKSQDQDDDRKRETKRRWLFKKSSISTVPQQTEPLKEKTSTSDVTAATTIKAAEAAATTANASAGIIRLTTRPSSILVKHHFAAILIQTSFRGYLARRAIRALKGIVMFQAVIRGQNVRKQATTTLRCMQALVRVQSRLQEQRSRLSHDGSRKSTVSENTTFWESKYLQDIRQRKSTFRDGGCIPDDLIDRPHINPSTMAVNELENNASLLDRWIKAKHWEHQRNSRASLDRRDSIETVEIDNSRLNSRPGTRGPHYIPNSPSRRSSYSPITPSPIKTRPLQIRSASPRCLKEERNYVNANVQSLRSAPRALGPTCRYNTCANDMAVPNYMAATESAKARIRSQSTPKQRPSTPEIECVGSVKKRLAYPSVIPDLCDNYKGYYCNYGHNLRSPSFKSVQVGHVGMGQQWCYADSTTGGELSPCSTTDLRRWLR